jgi:uncharacterized protein (DUF488 family)
VRSGNACTIFTIGYERRDPDEMISLLWDAGVQLLVDIRERPVSRKPDFREDALRARCEDAGIEYELWQELGSTADQREALKETGDTEGFRRRFRAYARRYKAHVVDRLARRAKSKTIALMCYERVHEDCHRAVVADLLADRFDATILAI